MFSALPLGGFLVGELSVPSWDRAGRSWYQLMYFLVARAICMLPRQWGRSRHPLTDILVGAAIHALPGQYDRSWHPLADFLVAKAIHAPGTVGNVLAPTDRSPGGVICTLPGLQGLTDRFPRCGIYLTPRDRVGRSGGPLAEFLLAEVSAPFQVSMAGPWALWWNS